MKIKDIIILVPSMCVGGSLTYLIKKVILFYKGEDITHWQLPLVILVISSFVLMYVLNFTPIIRHYKNKRKLSFLKKTYPNLFATGYGGFDDEYYRIMEDKSTPEEHLKILANLRDFAKAQILVKSQ